MTFSIGGTLPPDGSVVGSVLQDVGGVGIVASLEGTHKRYTGSALAGSVQHHSAFGSFEADSSATRGDYYLHNGDQYVSRCTQTLCGGKRSNVLMPFVYVQHLQLDRFQHFYDLRKND